MPIHLCTAINVPVGTGKLHAPALEQVAGEGHMGANGVRIFVLGDSRKKPPG